MTKTAKVAWGDEIYGRQVDVMPAEQARKYPITMVGCGHVGSVVALMLLKCGAFTGENTLTLIDHDDVGLENLAMQFFEVADVGKPKVEALASTLQEFGVGNIITIKDKFDPTKHSTDGIVISGVDSMAVRKMIFDATTEKTKLFLDARTGGELVTALAVNPGLAADRAFYMDNWVPDDQAAQDPCTNRGISWTTFAIASIIGNLFGCFCRNIPYPNRIDYDLRNWQMFTNYFTTPKSIAAKESKELLSIVNSIRSKTSAKVAVIE